MITKEVLDFLAQLEVNNNREWLAKHKDLFSMHEQASRDFLLWYMTG